MKLNKFPLVFAGLLSVAMAQSPRPVIEIPGDLLADYFRQAYVIEHATERQRSDIVAMQTYCAKNIAELQFRRNADDEISYFCVPTKKGE